MGTQSARGIKADEVTDDAVSQYLQTHLDFFERNNALLSKLRLPHLRHSGQTVSLLERQVDVLRERNHNLENRLKELMDVARSNELLTDKIHRFAQRMIRARNLAETVGAIESSLREDFDTMHAVLVLFLPAAAELQSFENRFLRLAQRDDAEMKTFDTFLTTARPRCGQVRDSQRDWLFGTGNNEIGSVALAPLGRDTSVGFLAIGSSDAERFHPTMSTDFLARIGEHAREAFDRYR